MSTAKRSVRMLLQLAFLYIAASCVTIFVPNVFLLRKISTFFLLALALALMFYLAEHIIDPVTRRYLVAISGLIVLWIVLRGAKYIAFNETGIIARHIWYLYYVSALLIPLLSMFAALSVGRPDWNHLPYATGFSIVFTAALLLLVLTNDLHQLAFRFRPGFENWDADYTRGPVFYLVYGWVAALLLGSLYVLYTRSRLSVSRKLIWIPAIPALFGLTYLTLYAAGFWPRIQGHLFGELPEAVCFTMGGLLLSLIYIGLIPSNARYGKLFEVSDLAAQITDRRYRVIYRSAGAVELSSQQMQSGEGFALDLDTRVHREPVSGGYVFWQDDVTKLNRINEELWELSEQLAEEAELARLENELKEARAQIEVKTRAYDEIAAEVLPQSERIADLCKSSDDAKTYPEHMKTVCLLAVYIKRYANLHLLAAEQETICTEELQLAVAETLRCVEDLGIPVREDFCGGREVVPSDLLAAYRLFETLLERALPRLRGLQVTIGPESMKMVFEGASLSLPEGCGASLTIEEDVSYVSRPFAKDGDRR